MKTRAEIAQFMDKQLKGKVKRAPGKFAAYHYGRCELRQLLDFIFDGRPTCKEDEAFEPLRLRNQKSGKWRAPK